MNPIVKENKVEKSLRNTKEFAAVLARAQAGDFDKELDAARSEGELIGTRSRLPLLKVAEIWTIRKHFSIEKGTDYFKLYKEKFYVENPGSNYFETVKPTVYRQVASQHEEGDVKWAKAVAAHLDISAEVNEATETTTTAAKRSVGRPRKTEQ